MKERQVFLFFRADESVFAASYLPLLAPLEAAMSKFASAYDKLSQIAHRTVNGAQATLDYVQWAKRFEEVSSDHEKLIACKSLFNQRALTALSQWLLRESAYIEMRQSQQSLRESIAKLLADVETNVGNPQYIVARDLVGLYRSRIVLAHSMLNWNALVLNADGKNYDPDLVTRLFRLQLKAFLTLVEKPVFTQQGGYTTAFAVSTATFPKEIALQWREDEGRVLPLFAVSGCMHLTAPQSLKLWELQEQGAKLLATLEGFSNNVRNSPANETGEQIHANKIHHFVENICDGKSESNGVDLPTFVNQRNDVRLDHGVAETMLKTAESQLTKLIAETSRCLTLSQGEIKSYLANERDLPQNDSHLRLCIGILINNCLAADVALRKWCRALKRTQELNHWVRHRQFENLLLTQFEAVKLKYLPR